MLDHFVVLAEGIPGLKSSYDHGIVYYPADGIQGS